MHVGVTGSSGFIGTALVSALEERGDSVTRFVRPGSDASGHVIHWDPSRGIVDDADLKIAGGFDAVVNLAGAGIADKRWNEARKSEIRNSRLTSTSLLVETMRAMPNASAHLVSGSAIGFYGSRGDEQLDESSSPGSGFLAQTCVEWEQAALALRVAGSTVALLRTGIVMDRRGGSLKRQLPLFTFGVGGDLASGHQWISPISLRDEVRAILWIIDHRLDGAVDAVCPNPSTNHEFTRILAHRMRRPALSRVPKFALDLVLGSELTSEAVVASQRVIPSALLASGFTFDDPDTNAIVRTVLSS